MASKEYVQKLREERQAKEQARIQKLKELNLKKYGQSESSLTANHVKPVKNNLTANGLTKKLVPPTRPQPSSTKGTGVPRQSSVNLQINRTKIPNNIQARPSTINKNTKSVPVLTPKLHGINMKTQNTATNKSNMSKNVLATSKPHQSSQQSLIPKAAGQNSHESVFDRLYKPKVVQKPKVDETQKLRNDPSYLRKIINSSNLITNRRHTTFETKKKDPIRRSISAVHFKKISKNEIKNCIHKWASIGEKIDKESVKDINEDENTTEEKIVSAVKSERKKVKFQTPLNDPEEMLSKLNKWLRVRGKSIDSYPHLKCFGVHHQVNSIPKFDYDDENKENIALDHDSDNESFTEMNCKDSKLDLGKWRSPSCSDSVDFNESYQTTMTSEMSPREDELLLGALNHLTELLRSGYNWEECARWLRAVRDRYSHAQDTAAYWECRAALEERRGDLSASMQCWEHAIAKGAESTLVEASLDQLLDKFMQLKINPASAKKQKVDPKLVDAKNVFKSTLIRFAVQEIKSEPCCKTRPSPKFYTSKLENTVDTHLPTSKRRNHLPDVPKATVTPVRRSTRLSCYRGTTPLKIFNTIQQAMEAEHAEFKPNKAIAGTP